MRLLVIRNDNNDSTVWILRHINCTVSYAFDTPESAISRYSI